MSRVTRIIMVLLLAGVFLLAPVWGAFGPEALLGAKSAIAAGSGGGKGGGGNGGGNGGGGGGNGGGGNGGGGGGGNSDGGNSGGGGGNSNAGGESSNAGGNGVGPDNSTSGNNGVGPGSSNAGGVGQSVGKPDAASSAASGRSAGVSLGTSAVSKIQAYRTAVLANDVKAAAAALAGVTTAISATEVEQINEILGINSEATSLTASDIVRGVEELGASNP